MGKHSDIPVVDPFGLPCRTFYPNAIRPMIGASGLKVQAENGVDVFVDLLNPPPEKLDELMALEKGAGTQMPYRQTARCIHVIAECMRRMAVPRKDL